MTTDDLLPLSDSPASAAEDTASAPDMKLTERNWQVFNVLRDTAHRQGYPPSLREICEAVGLASTSSAAYQLRELEKKGLIALDPRRPRSYRILANDSSGPKFPALRHVGCPLLADDSDEEQTDQAVVLEVVLDPAISRALRSGALLTVQQLPAPDTATTTHSGATVLGKVTAVTHAVGRPFP